MRTPSVKPSVCQLPRQGAFWFTANQKLSPQAGDSSRARPVGDAARGESGGIGSIASGSVARRPYSNQRCGCECNEQTEGLHRGCCYLRQPLSQSALRRIASSPPGEPFGLPPTKSCPHEMGKVAASVTSSRKGNGSEQPSYFPLPPQSACADSSPSGEPFGVTPFSPRSLG